MSDYTEVSEALNHIDAGGERAEWVKVLAATKDALGEGGRALALGWSEGASNFKNEKDFDTAWDSITVPGAVKKSSLFYLAGKNGYKPAKATRKRTPSAKAGAKSKTKTSKDAKKREAEELRQHQLVADAAQQDIDKAEPATYNHPYLKAKGINPYGVLAAGTSLLIPLVDIDGKLWNRQSIYRNGTNGDGTPKFEKRYVTGPMMDDGKRAKGRKTDCMFWMGDKPNGSARNIVIVEGFATGASLMAVIGPGGPTATVNGIVVAFDAGNVVRVARIIQERHPDFLITIGADNDHGKARNAGELAAKKTGLAYVMPTPIEGRDSTDWNDVHLLEGAASVCEQWAKNRVTPGISDDGEAPPVGDAGNGEAPQDDVDNSMPPWGQMDGDYTATDEPKPKAERGRAIDRPAYVVLDNWEQVEGANRRPGVWFFGEKLEKDGSTTDINAWICSPLHVTAQTCGTTGSDHGLLLQFKTPRGSWRSWAMPMCLLGGDGSGLRSDLLKQGVRITPLPNDRRRLDMFLQSQHHSNVPHMTAMDRTGWFERRVFVLPQSVIGEDRGAVTFQHESVMDGDFSQKGTHEAWLSFLSQFIDKNPMTLFALCVSAAGPLLRLLDIPGGGFHLVGDSSRGKTTLLALAASLWGAHELFTKAWAATSNGLEGVASSRNDTIILLDDISNSDPKEVGKIVYLVCNGIGKARANRAGGARQTKSWKLMLLSSGERTLSSHMREAGLASKAGQEIRMVDLLATERGHGAFDDLCEFDHGAALADFIMRESMENYGHAGPQFIERLLRDPDFDGITEQLAAVREKFVSSTGQEARVAARFAAVALAGELLIKYKLIPAAPGLPTTTCIELFQQWREARGDGDAEPRQILEQVSEFIDAYRDSRFSPITTPTNFKGDDMEFRVVQRAGWYTDDEPGEGRVYLFTAGGFKTAIGGHDVKRAIQALTDAGWFSRVGGNGKTQVSKRVAGGVKKLYHIRPVDLAES